MNRSDFSTWISLSKESTLVLATKGIAFSLSVAMVVRGDTVKPLIPRSFCKAGGGGGGGAWPDLDQLTIHTVA